MIDFIIITGPTAVGKSDLSEKLALRCNAEIIAADSQTVYRGLTVGTAKPALPAQVPYHMIDVCDPDTVFDVSAFLSATENALDDIVSRGKHAVVSGGTPMYINRLVTGFTEAPGSDEVLRVKLQEQWKNDGQQLLREELERVDHASAKRIHPNDAQRTIRALEVYHTTGKTLSEWHKATPESPYSYLYIVLNRKRDILYDRINSRVDAMLEGGWVDEVKELLKKYTGNEKAFESLGYRTIISHLNGDLSYSEAVHCIKRDTRHFARRQLIWFRKVPDAVWYDLDEQSDDVIMDDILGRIQTKGGLR